MIQKLILFICCIALLFSDVAFAAEKTIGRNRPTEQRVALVIGNGAYTSVQRLTNPPKDAAGMARALRELGFDVTERTNLTADAMNEEIFAFGSQLRSSGGVGLFYFSGHGVQHEGRNYLIPVGANIQREKQLKFRAIDAGSVLDEMEEARNRMNIVILDACRNNPFASKFKSYGRSGLASMDAPAGTVIAYATGPGKTASEGPGRYSLYTHELIRQMKIPGQRLVDMFNGIRKKVRTRTDRKQIPWESTSLEGPFYFNPSGMAADGSAVILTPSPEARKGGLRVKTTPSGATVWVDGAQVGRSPVTLMGLNSGDVQVRAELEGYRGQGRKSSPLTRRWSRK